MAKTPAKTTKSAAKPPAKIKTAEVLEEPVEAKATFSFGMVFDINGTAVPISTADIANIKKNGAKFAIPNPVRLGSFNDLISWIETTFSVKFPDTADLPEFIKNIVDKILDMVFTVNVLSLEVPGTKDPGKSMQYALEIAGEFSGEPLQPIPGFPLGIQGGVFGVTNIPSSS